MEYSPAMMNPFLHWRDSRRDRADERNKAPGNLTINLTAPATGPPPDAAATPPPSTEPAAATHPPPTVSTAETGVNNVSTAETGVNKVSTAETGVEPAATEPEAGLLCPDHFPIAKTPGASVGWIGRWLAVDRASVGWIGLLLLASS